MKYTDWITELKANLLGVSEAERRKVLDYYAEAYADRRAAGYSENEIIDGFGAPYDAAQTILENETENSAHTQNMHYSPPHPSASQPTVKAKEKRDYTWVFVILCIVFAIPIFSIIMTMVGITIGFAVAPFSTIVSGAAQIILGIFKLLTGEVGYGITNIGIGFIVLGIGIIIIKLCFALVKLMWKLFTKFFKWLSGLFKGEN